MDDDQSTPENGRKKLLAEGLFHVIGERIIRGDLPPGARIRDADLAAELQVSRTPVREALQRLERIGLVVMYPSRYTEVTSVTPDAIAAAHAFAGLQAGIIVRLACPRLTAAERDEVCELIDRIPATVDDAAACSNARRATIGYLAARSGNPLQQALVDEASLALARALKTFEITAAHRDDLREGAQRLADALREGDADAAEAACRRMYGVA